MARKLAGKSARSNGEPKINSLSTVGDLALYAPLVRMSRSLRARPGEKRNDFDSTYCGVLTRLKNGQIVQVAETGSRSWR
jgi:hypothetical protein